MSKHMGGRSVSVGCWVAMGVLVPSLAAAATLQVGPDKTYKKVQDAVAAAQSGDTIEVDPGDYVDDISVIKVGDLTIRGVGGARPHLKATQPPPNKKGILVIPDGVGPVTIEHLEISGSRISEGDGNNGAGIRAQGTDLTVRDCYIHDNQNGILSNGSLMTIEYNELAYNGEAGYEHNVYVSGGTPKLVFRGNYSHHANHGYALKSRADENHILYNRLMEEADGNGSGLIDLPQGGLSYVIGNLIQKGPGADNKNRIILYKGEGDTNPELRLFVSHNTFVNDGAAGATFIDVVQATEVVVGNNLFVGPGTLSKIDPNAAAMDLGNLQTDLAGLIDRAGFNYDLLMDSPAIDVGVALPAELMPDSQYLQPAMVEARPVVGAPDVGAYEFGEGEPSTTGGEESSGGGETGGSNPTSGETASTDPTGSDLTDTAGNSDGTAGTGGGSESSPTESGQTTSGSDGTGAGATTSATASETGEPSASNDDSGCGCRSEGGSGLSVLIGLGALGLRRRRR